MKSDPSYITNTKHIKNVWLNPTFIAQGEITKDKREMTMEITTQDMEWSVLDELTTLVDFEGTGDVLVIALINVSHFAPV